MEGQPLETRLAYLSSSEAGRRSRGRLGQQACLSPPPASQVAHAQLITFARYVGAVAIAFQAFRADELVL